MSVLKGQGLYFGLRENQGEHRMRKILSVSAISLLLALPTFAAKGDCKGERKNLCSHCEKGDRQCFKSCMKSKKSQLSQKCKDHWKERRKAKRAKKS